MIVAWWIYLSRLKNLTSWLDHIIILELIIMYIQEPLAIYT